MNLSNQKSRFLFAIFVVVVFLGGALTANATVTTGLDPESGAATCPVGYGLEDFESGTDGSPIVSTIPGVEFTATNGHDWLTGDWGAGYNGKYPNGAYTSGGRKWAWLGTSQSSGKIDFTAGKASYVSIYTSTFSGLALEAYADDGTFLESSGWATNNIGTGKMTILSISRPTADIGYVVVHDSGNYWLIDWLCTDAGAVPTKFWTEISSGSVLTLRSKPEITDVTRLKQLPDGWVVYVTNTFDDDRRIVITPIDAITSYRWYQVKDETDGTTGWMVAGKVGSDGKFIEEYLKYKSIEQDTLHDFATITPALKGAAGRLSKLVEAVDNYYNNTDIVNMLKSSDNGSNNISLLKKSNFPKDLVVAIAKAESDIINFDNEWVTFDLGHGLMQVTTQSAVGGGSGIHVPLCEPPNDRYLCYGPTHSASVLEYGVEIRKWPKKDYRQYKYYENTAQAIYANVKDGMRWLRHSYEMAKNVKGVVVNGVTYTDEDMKNISATYRYNQGSPYRVQAVYMIYEGIKTLKQIQNELISHGALPSWVEDNITSDWQAEVQDRCKSKEDFSKCLVETNKVGLTTSALYLTNVAERLKSTNPILADKMSQVNNSAVILWLRSPGELRVTDSFGNVTGVVSGIAKEDVPNSVYDAESGLTTLFFPTPKTKYEVKGTATGTYGLVITNMTSRTTVAMTDIPTTERTTHVYTIDWDILAVGGDGVTMKIDADGDGVFENEVKGGAKITHDDVALQTKTTVDFDPDAFNMKNSNGVATAYIELPQGFDVHTIDTSSVKLNGVSALHKPVSIGDYDGDSIPDLMVKFERGKIKGALSPKNGAVKVTITGKVLHRGRLTSFAGSDTIKIIE